MGFEWVNDKFERGEEGNSPPEVGVWKGMLDLLGNLKIIRTENARSNVRPVESPPQQIDLAKQYKGIVNKAVTAARKSMM
jgi:hypothetical protein